MEILSRLIYRALLLLCVAEAMPGTAVAADATPADWTGAYFGVQGGFVSGAGDIDVCDQSQSPSCYSAREGKELGSISAQGGLIGAYVGLNYQFDKVVIGIEGEIGRQFADGNSRTGKAFSGEELDVSLEWDANIRARAGVAFDRTLIYVTAGPNWMSEDIKWRICEDGRRGLNCVGREAFDGFVLGAGLETLLTDRLSAKLEFMRYWYGDPEFNLVSGPVTDFTLKQDLKVNEIRAGLAYHIN